MTEQNRRKASSRSEDELYKTSKASINAFIKKERRKDELDRLREVQSQKKVWRRTVYFCAFINLLFLILAFMGAIKNGF